MNFHNVTVLGTGVLGAQIAFQTAYRGFPVVAYDINDEMIAKAHKTVDYLAERYSEEVKEADAAAIEATRARLSFSTDLGDAVKKADLVIEAVPERLDIKRDVYAKLATVAPEQTVFATNSSTLLPSAIADATGRPERFLALHFANEIWKHNTAEIMGHPGTSPEIYNEVVEFARDIGMEAIELHKEQPGYVLNTLLVPFLGAAGALVAKGIAEPVDIDKVWRIATGAPVGPFQIYDVVGLNTAYNISLNGDETSQRFARYLKENYIDKGKLGILSGEGFYSYKK